MAGLSTRVCMKLKENGHNLNFEEMIVFAAVNANVVLQSVSSCSVTLPNQSWYRLLVFSVLY